MSVHLRDRPGSSLTLQSRTGEETMAKLGFAALLWESTYIYFIVLLCIILKEVGWLLALISTAVVSCAWTGKHIFLCPDPHVRRLYVIYVIRCAHLCYKVCVFLHRATFLPRMQAYKTKIGCGFLACFTCREVTLSSNPEIKIVA